MGGIGSGWHGGNGRPRRKRRVSECFAVMKAEHVYAQIQSAEPMKALGVEWADVGRWTIAVDQISNPLWRRGGRLFLRCPRCNRRCARLYMPDKHDELKCRLCWRLSYYTRQAVSYRIPRGLIRQLLGVLDDVEGA